VLHESKASTFEPHFGAVVHDEGVRFVVWAPALRALALAIAGEPELQMSPDREGFFSLDLPTARPAQRYWFRTPQGLRPDPASRFQPDGPLGPSEIVDFRDFPWTDHNWRGAVARHRHVIYELHLGTFTKEGTWAAAAQRLPDLADIGVTTIEVMPIAEFAGAFGWGYDGVNFFAPSRLYGSPDDARRFVDEAHRLGLAVILDVVYNHFGPVGNFTREFSSTIQGKRGEWGDAINYDGEGSGPVRAFMAENAAFWIREYHFDGLRLDATQAIEDSSPEHIVSEICRAARRAAGGRRLFIVGESEPQDTRLLKEGGAYSDGLDAIWSEDWHHAAYVALTGRRHAYFTDYQGTAAEFASMARHGCLYQGQWYSWQTKPRGGYALELPTSSFITFLENHDQVANTGLGSRLYHIVDAGLWRALTSLLLLGPAIPMLFQGQEFGSKRPFTYFADHAGDIGAAVESGRLEFLTQFPGLTSEEMRKLLPRPGDPEQFAQCKLLDEERSHEGALKRLHRDLIRLRQQDEVLSHWGTDEVRVEASAPTATVVLIRYLMKRAHRLLVVNLADDHLSPMNDPLFAPRPGAQWRLEWGSDHPDYGGCGIEPLVRAGRWLIRSHAAMWLAC
jgi:maltooligosyltrehalose trehalohydrolase